MTVASRSTLVTSKSEHRSRPANISMSRLAFATQSRTSSSLPLALRTGSKR